MSIFSSVKIFSKSKKSNPFLILDIGSEAIKAFVFQKKKDKIIVLGKSIYYLDPFRTWDNPLTVEQSRPADADFETEVVHEFVNKAVNEVVKQVNQDIKEMALSLSPLVFKAFFKKTDLKRTSPRTVISKEEEKEIINKIKTEFSKFALSRMVERYHMKEEEIVCNWIHIISFKIDGYQVPFLKGFRGEDITVSGLVFAMSAKYLDQQGRPVFISELTQKMKFKGLFHQAQYLAYSALSFKDGIFIDIGGKTSDIFVVKDGSLIDIGQIEMGGSAFTRIISESLGLDKFGAQELKAKYAAGQLEEQLSLKLKKKFESVFSEWVNQARQYFASLETPVLSHFFLYGGGCLMPEFKFLETKLTDLPLTGEYKIDFLLPMNLPGIEGGKFLSNHPQETPVLLLSYIY